jgi:hypothetical protein
VSPENLQSSDLVNILSKDDDTFVRDSRPTKYFFSIEMSMYEIISREMLNFFASVVEFNNYIGEPKYMYRSNYKDLEKLRNLFFEKVGAKPDLQKFVSLYKWFDSALDVIIANMIPLSATVYDKVRTVVESHVLERHKYSSIKEFQVGEDKDVLFNTDNVQTSFDSTVTSIPKDPVGSSINLDKTPPVGDGF